MDFSFSEEEDMILEAADQFAERVLGAQHREHEAAGGVSDAARKAWGESGLAELAMTSADLGVHLMFSGHTHGGQCRLPGGRALMNCSSLPLHLTCGMLRHQDTVCIVSRGLGETRLRLRLFCPPHVPVVTLRRGPLPGRHTNAIENVRRW